MFEKLETPRDVFLHKLGSALEMEQTILKMLGKLEGEAQSEQLKQMLRHHAGETEHHIRNVEQAFTAMGVEADDSPSPVAKALDKEGKANIKMADDRLDDLVILSGAAETEHHEMAVYEALIIQAEAMGQDAVVTLLRQNHESEEHTLREVEDALRGMARQTAAMAA
jgi:ferritin-like metal-binding protein YciE